MRLKDFVLGAVVGGVAAGVTVALTTPKKGEELRGDLKEKAVNMYEEGSKVAASAYEKGSEKFSDAKDYAIDKANASKDYVTEKANAAKDFTLEQKEKITNKKIDLDEDDFIYDEDEVDSKLSEIKDNVLNS